MTLGEYILAASARKFEWGGHDCSTFAADWRVLNGLPDPMADIRGRYHDHAGAESLIYEGGGLLKLWSDRMPAPTKNPSAGAVGCALINSEQIMSIYTGERWVFLMQNGIKAMPVSARRILKAWPLG